MNVDKIYALLLGSLLLLPITGASAGAEGSVAERSGAMARIDGSQGMPLYRPPRRGAPMARVGGGTRGIDREIPDLYVLAPDHVGLTSSEQPTLSWYMSKPSTMRFEFLLIDEEGIDPVLELTMDPKELKTGIQAIDLAKHGVKLKTGVKYQWSVSLIPDANHRSGDIISSGMIERVDPDESIRAKLDKAKSTQDVYIFADSGYWYDAVSTLSTLIEQDPGNEPLRQQRAALLEQVGVPVGK